MERLRAFIRAVLAGAAISIGGYVFLSCDNRYVGAFFFCVGLITVVMFALNLYTGKVGYVITEDRTYLLDTVLSVPGNLLGCLAVGLSLPPKGNVYDMCLAKLDKSLPAAFADAVFCGILIYVCVQIWKKRQNVVGILFCVPVFILCGFEHSVADMFYFANARIFSTDTALLIFIIILGNAVGSILFHGLVTLCDGEKMTFRRKK